jgi:hypothetical protein
MASYRIPNPLFQVRVLVGVQNVNFSTHTAVRWAKLDTIPRSWE